MCISPGSRVLRSAQPQDDKVNGKAREGDLGQKLITIHNGIKEINFLDKNESLKKFLKPETLNQKPTVIGSIGNLYPTKGFKYLIKAAKILPYPTDSYSMVSGADI